MMITLVFVFTQDEEEKGETQDRPERRRGEGKNSSLTADGCKEGLVCGRRTIFR
jgi:hypothetical protein